MAPKATPHVDSPGNSYSPAEQKIPKMRMPHLRFIYRIVANMSSDTWAIPNVQQSGVTRMILPIKGGTVKGPRIQGEIIPDSGADWLERVLSRLHAMYTLRTSDGHNILVKADGIFKEGPGGNFDPSADMTATQDQVEYFTHIRFEAPGNSPYDWMNDVVAIGVMTMFEGKPIIDCYSLTNFPDFEASL
ncbi:hypothetical protein KJ359_003799 [Pestalotiopsis sp. 9143b]|nr:hypothetical protein KJ359_003799 [Pestalotiopsis sp. 9143b]